VKRDARTVSATSSFLGPPGPHTDTGATLQAAPSRAPTREHTPHMQRALSAVR
jgi:hypothetical protein